MNKLCGEGTFAKIVIGGYSEIIPLVIFKMGNCMFQLWSDIDDRIVGLTFKTIVQFIS